MTRLALAGRGGWRGNSGETKLSARAELTKPTVERRSARPMAPMPMPQRRRNWRRVKARCSGSGAWFIGAKDLDGSSAGTIHSASNDAGLASLSGRTGQISMLEIRPAFLRQEEMMRHL